MEPNEPTNLRNRLALDRTALANERTFLAYWRTALGAFIAGLMLLKLDWGEDRPLTHALGAVFMVLAPLTAAVGIWRYRTMQARIGQHGPSDHEATDHDRLPFHHPPG